MISKTGIHAIRAVATLAALPEGAYAGAGDIAEQIGAPQNYLGKVLKTLADEGLLESQKGKGGGFRLARSPERISMFDVVDPIDHLSRWSGCILGRATCSDDSPCTVHHRWKEVRDVYLTFLRETSISDLLSKRRGVPAATC
jgi:Rrf2 family iron-sulfur cluster assembly transcriptional regulator